MAGSVGRGEGFGRAAGDRRSRLSRRGRSVACGALVAICATKSPRPRPGGGVRAGFVREARGRRREGHGEVRETPGTSPWREGDGAVGKTAPASVRCLFAYAVQATNGASGRRRFPQEAIRLRDVPGISLPSLPKTCRPCDVSPQGHRPCASSPRKTSQPGRFGGGLSLPGPPPKRPGARTPAAAARTLARPRPQRPGPSPVPRRNGPNPRPSRCPYASGSSLGGICGGTVGAALPFSASRR